VEGRVVSGKTPTPKDFGEAFKLIGGYRISQALYVAVELGIPDLLTNGPKHCDDLAVQTQTHGPTLYRVLRFLAGAGLFNEIAPREFELTQLGSALRGDIQGSIGPAVRLWLSESHWVPWSQLLHSVRSGEHAFSRAHGIGVFDYLNQNPEIASIFNATMTAGSARLGAALVKEYDFSGIRKIVDVGGGHGFTLATILAAHPAMHGVLYDQPDVVAGAAPVLDKAGISNRCEVIGGSFFDSVPPGADAYVLKQVVHDWDDEQSLAILRNCRAVLPKGGKLLLVERQIAENNREAMRVLHIDMEMLINVSGLERTDAEYRSLFERAGFRPTGIVPLMDGAGFSVFEAVREDGYGK
jgi:hypothetical protein